MREKIFLYGVVVLASLSGLLAGFDTGVISGALLFIDKTFEMTPELSGLLVSSVSSGAIIGAFINGFFIDKCGRKNILLLAAFIFLVGSVACSFSQTINQLIFFRGFLGCAVGIVSFAGPLYLSEISSKDKRGSIVSCYQVAITLGILFSYLINFSCAGFVYNWRIMLFMGAIPSLILFLGMLFQSDTPRWYVLNGEIDKATLVLKKFECCTDVNSELKCIETTVQASKEKIPFDLNLIKPFVIGIGIMFVQIATGINAIIYYAPTIFKNIGFTSNQDALLITIFIGVINFLMTFVAIAFVDKWGRKPLLYIGLSGMLISLLVLSSVFAFNIVSLKFISIIACAVYIISFSMSLGPIALLLISEIFPLRYRGQAMSVAIISNFVFNFIVTFLFPIFLSKLGGCFTFLIFTIICILSLLFVHFVVPETKGQSLEEIEDRI